jgi:hypothetical protein
MYYLKCTQCAHFNLVRTEYQIICEKCGRKLDNNYRDWLIENQGKNFGDFLKSECFTEAELNKQLPRKKKPMPVIAKVAIILGSILLLLAPLGWFAYQKSKSFILEIQKNMDPDKQEWVRRSYPGTYMSVESPSPLDSTTLPFPEEVKQLIAKSVTFQHSTITGMAYAIVCIEYKPQVNEANLEGAANGVLTYLKSTENTSNFTYEMDSLNLNDIRGIKLTGSYKQKVPNNPQEIDFNYEYRIYAKKLKLWQSYVIYPQKLKYENFANRFLNSIEINDVTIE